MFIKKSWFRFYRDEFPDWQCPTCGMASLNFVSEKFHVHDSGETAKAKTSDYFDADWVQYRFSAVLQCSNSRCNEVVTMVGSGEVETDHLPGEDRQWDVIYRDCFSPSFFQPCLVPISIPENTPSEVSNSLNRSFALIFANRDAAANQLRIALEVLLDEQGVKSKDKNDESLKLDSRVNHHLDGEFVKNKDLIK